VFFDGEIEAETLLARAGARWDAKEETSSGDQGHRGWRPGQRFQRRHERVAACIWGPVVAVVAAVVEEAGTAAEAAARVMAQQEMAGGRLHLSMRSTNRRSPCGLRLTNHGPTAVDIEVVDFNSALGDFAVQAGENHGPTRGLGRGRSHGFAPGIPPRRFP